MARARAHELRQGPTGPARARLARDLPRALAARAAEAGDSAPADPAFPGLAPKADPPAVEGFDEATAEIGPEDQARLAAAAIEASELDLYGFFTSGLTELALASTTGLAVSQTSTDASVLA